jgi:hypothetical protein
MLAPIRGDRSAMFRLFKMIVRRFFGNLHIVDVRFANTGRGNFYELGFLVHIINCFTAKITHTRAYSTDELMDYRDNTTFEGNASFDPFRHQFLGVSLGLLKIPVA